MKRRGYEGFAIDDLRDHELAADYIGDLLIHRELVLLLGAGISANVGLPDWEALVTHCESGVGLKHDGARRTSEELMRAIDRVARKLRESVKDPDAALRNLVREGLYSEAMLAEGSYPTDVVQQPLLIALGALVMASARGSVADVFTLNFDDLLEWYLHLHGFRTQVVSDFPTDLRGDVDLTVFHPHGFVPLIESVYSASDWLVLSHTQLVARLAAGHDSPWPTLLASRFLSKSFVAVGTSMRDFDIDVLLTRTLDARGREDPLGFVVTDAVDESRAADLLDLCVVPIETGTRELIPDFLLSACQSAAARMH